MSKKIVLFYLIDLLILLIIGLFFGINIFLSSLVGFVFSILIIAFSFRAYKNRQDKEIQDINFQRLYEQKFKAQSAQETDGALSYDESDDDIKKNGKAYRMMFFSPFKLLSYIVFIVFLFLLVKFHYFNGFGVVIGVALVQITNFIYGWLNDRFI